MATKANIMKDKNKLHLGDSLEFMGGFSDESVQLQVTSPPYNIGKEYENSHSIDQYLDGIKPMISDMYRICSSKGSVCWQVGNYVKGQEIFPLDFFFYPIFKEAGFKLRNRIIWRFESGLHSKNKFSGRYEVVLWFTKTDEYKFDLDGVRVPSKYPGKRHYKGDKKGTPSCNPAGKNPSDFWTLKDDWEKLVWEVPNVKANHIEKTQHPCQFPIELVERFVIALSDPGDIVYDPFSGSGTTVMAAIMNGRRGFGSEKEFKYHSIALERMKMLEAGTLPYRMLGKSIHKPSGKVSEIPAEWMNFHEDYRRKMLSVAEVLP